MKRLTVFLFLGITMFIALPAQAEEESDWFESVQAFGKIDARMLMWDKFTPDNEDFDDISGSDIYLYWASLGVIAEPTDYLKGVVSLNYEQEPSTGQIAAPADMLYVDEAYVKFNLFWLYFQMGQMYAPVIHYQPLSVSDSLPYLLAETWQTAYDVGLDSEYFTLSFSQFNGGNDLTDADDAIDDWVVRLDLRPLTWLPDYDVSLGGAYLADATETTFGLANTLGGDYEDNVAGYTAYLSADLKFMDNFGMAALFEYASTMEFDKDNYLNTEGDATSISAMNAELAFVVYKNFWFGPKWDTVSGLDWLDAESFEPAGQDDYQALSYSRIGGFLGVGNKDDISLAIEYLHGTDNESNTTDALTMQILLNY